MKQRQQQQRGEDPLMPAPRFSALISEPMARRTAVALKLTDECSAAVHEAAAGRRKIRLHHQPDACFLEVATADGTMKRFECAVQSMGQPIDAVHYDATTSGGQFQTVAALHSKIQVRATDRTFAETREKAQKLVEEQQKHKAKDMNSRIHARGVVTASSQRRLLSGAAASALSTAVKSKAPTFSIRPSNALAPNLSGSAGAGTTTTTTKPPATISASKFGISTARLPTSTGLRVQPSVNRSPHGSQSGMVRPTVEPKSSPAAGGSPSIGLGGPSSRIGYAPRNPPPTFRKRPAPSTLTSGGSGKSVSPVVPPPSAKELTTATKPPPLIPELDGARSANYHQQSSLLASATAPPSQSQPSHHNSGNGPPPEKRRAPYASGYGIMSTGTGGFVPASGEADTMPAIQPTADTTPSPSPSSVASSTMDSPSSTYGGGRSSNNVGVYGISHGQSVCSGQQHHRDHRDRQQRPTDYAGSTAAGQSVLPSAGSQPVERQSKDSFVSAGGAPRDENWRTEPTTDAVKTAQYVRPVIGQKRNADDGGNDSMTRETRPSRNYRDVFREIRDLNEAKRYHDIFAAEYPEYRECYELLSRVAAEFHELERALKRTAVNTPDRDKMEEAIQSKFVVYQNDENFLHKRQRHTDLRVKLDVLKQRIIDWERRQPKRTAGHGASGGQPQLSDMMVM